jgi:hypothetical protein
VRFVIEHEESKIPTEFREAIKGAALGKMVDVERVMPGESLLPSNGLPLRGYRRFLDCCRRFSALPDSCKIDCAAFAFVRLSRGRLGQNLLRSQKKY